MVATLIPIAIVILLLVLCAKGVMWGATLVVMLQGAVSCLVVALVILFALPTEGVVVGPNMPYLPVCVMALILLAALIAIFLAQRSGNVASGRHNKLGIATLILGLVLWLVGFLFFCLFIFANAQGGPDPQAAVITFSALNLVGAIALFLATRCETSRFPNLYRWLVFWMLPLMHAVIFAFSMIFIFAYPGEQQVTHPFWASMMTLNYLPPALLFVAINHRYVKKPADETTPGAADDTPDSSFG